MMTVRSPKDEDEHFKAMLAVANGRGRSIADVIQEITGQPPSEEEVETVTNRLRMAQESGESIDILSVIKELHRFAEQWA